MKTVLLFDGSQIDPRLHRAIMPADIHISKIVPLSTTAREQRTREQRVRQFANLLGGCELTKLTAATQIATLFEREKPDRVILTVTEKTALLTCLKSALAAGASVCIGQPSIFNTLDFEELIGLYALAESTNARCVAQSRFCFSPSIHQIKNLLEDPDFGGINDLSFKTSWGPSGGGWEDQYTYLASHASHVVFFLLADHGLPDQMTVLEVFKPKIRPPSFSIAMYWDQEGVLANLFLTAARSWGTTHYHTIDISGKSGGYIKSDLLKFEGVLDGHSYVQYQQTDDDQGANTDGSAPKLRYFFHGASQRQDAESLLDDAHPILMSFWLRDTILSLRKRKKNSITLGNLRRHIRTEMKTGDNDIRLLARQGHFKEAIALAKQKLI